MDEKYNNSKDLFSFKNIFIGLLIVVSLPLLISCIITWGDWLSYFEGNSTVWIGFWGSYLGGIVGTAGVVIVAKMQMKINQDNLVQMEKDNRDRLKIDTLTTRLEDYRDFLSKYNKSMKAVESYLSLICLYQYRLSEGLYDSDENFYEFEGFIEDYQMRLNKENLSFRDDINEIVTMNERMNGIGITLNNSQELKGLEDSLIKLKMSIYVISLPNTIKERTINERQSSYRTNIGIIKRTMKEILTEDHLEEFNDKLKENDIIYLLPFETLCDWLKNEIELVDDQIINQLKKLNI